MQKILKKIVFIWFYFWIGLGALLIFGASIQIVKNRKFINEKIKPSVDYIKNFNTIHKRLPNKVEYYTWRRDFHKDYTSDLTQTDDSMISPGGPYIRNGGDVLIGEYGIRDSNLLNGVDWSKNFAIGVWRGESYDYYFSWTDSYYGNNYSWDDCLIELLIIICTGVLPLLIWGLTKIKKAAHNNI
ncbi:MAG: hypothetical protein ACK40G_02165 [Cytophagaceae bacterium]